MGVAHPEATEVARPDTIEVGRPEVADVARPDETAWDACPEERRCASPATMLRNDVLRVESVLRSVGKPSAPTRLAELRAELPPLLVEDLPEHEPRPSLPDTQASLPAPPSRASPPVAQPPGAYGVLAALPASVEASRYK